MNANMSLFVSFVPVLLLTSCISLTAFKYNWLHCRLYKFSNFVVWRFFIALFYFSSNLCFCVFHGIQDKHMAALVSERLSSTGKLKVQLMMDLNFLLHTHTLLVDEMHIRFLEH